MTKESLLATTSTADMERYLTYLDNLRLRGTTNMFGAAPFIQRSFGLSKPHAHAVLAYWMETFSERHKAAR